MTKPRWGKKLRTPRPATEPRVAQPGISTKNTEKTAPQTEIPEPKKDPHQNTEKIHKMGVLVFWGIFSIFSAYFGGKFWESRISGRGGVFFWYFSRKFRVGPSRFSVAGRGLKHELGTCCLGQLLNAISPSSLSPLSELKMCHK